MRQIFYFIVFLLLFVQTFFGQEVIHIDPLHTSYKTIALSDLVETIEYIPLETNDNCLIGDVGSNEIIFSNNYILVHSKLFYLFIRNGKFVTQIGNIGNGPGEYLEYAARPFSIDEENQRISISHSLGTEMKLMIYDFRGKYLNSVTVDKRLGAIFHAKFDKKYIMMNLNNVAKAGEPPFNYSIFSDDYKLITEKIKNVDYTIQQTSGGFVIPKEEGFFHYLYNRMLHVKGSLNDTIYSITQNLSFLPKYIINTGRYAITKQILSDWVMFERVYQSRVFISSVFENDNYVLISYRYQNKNYYHLYDKKRHDSMLSNSTTGIPNDYDGGMDFWPKIQNGNEFITWYNAYLFEDNVNRLKPKGSENDVGKYKKMRKEIDLESNPVLVIIKMKQ